MNISEVTTILSPNDIKSIINDFIKVEGLKLTDILIKNDEIKVVGSFKKGLALGFKASVTVIGVEDNKLTIRLKRVSLMKIGILKPFRRIALKLALKGFKERGILLSSDKITIDISKILEAVKLIKLNLTHASIENDHLNVTAREIDLLIAGDFSKKPSVVAVETVNLDEEILTEEEKEDYILNLAVEKKDDAYTHGREAVVEKIPEKAKTYSDIIMFVPDILALLARLFKDNRVPRKTKIALAISLGYTIIPIDILPDKIPVIGKIDDIALIMFAVNRMIEDIPIEVILENWQGNREFVIVLKGFTEYLVGFTGAKNLNKVYEVINSFA